MSIVLGGDAGAVKIPIHDRVYDAEMHWDGAQRFGRSAGPSAAATARPLNKIHRYGMHFVVEVPCIYLC